MARQAGGAGSGSMRVPVGAGAAVPGRPRPRHGGHATLARLLAAGLWLASGAALAQAEVAMRWRAADGGPATAQAVADQLGWAPGKRTAFTVAYLPVQPPAGTPAGVQAILRERSRPARDGGTKVETTFKLRGGREAPALPLARWACPLKGKADRKDELDISVLGGEEVRRSFSRSCTVDSPAADAARGLKTRPAGCTHAMSRLEAEVTRSGSVDTTASRSVDIEEWHVEGGVVLEVSAKGPADAATLAQFRKDVVEPLQRLGAKPLDRSMTEIGSACS